MVEGAPASPAAQLGAIAIAGAIVSAVLWLPMSIPTVLLSRVVNAVTGNFLYELCRTLEVESAPMFMCSAAIGIMVVASGPLLLAAGMFVVRSQIAQAVKKLTAGVPAAGRFMVAPLTAVLLFLPCWAGAHASTASNMGLLPQTIFPTVIGLFTWATGRATPWVQHRMDAWLAWRDGLSFAMRVAIPVIVPLVASVVFTRLVIGSSGSLSDSNAAVPEQLTVLVALVAGFLTVVPRRGTLLEGAQALWRERR